MTEAMVSRVPRVGNGGFDIHTLRIEEDYYVGDIQTADEAKEAMIKLSLTIASIQAQITEAKNRAAAGDQYSDHVWWRKVNAALAIHKAARQYVQDLHAKLNKEERLKRSLEIKKTRDEKLINALRALVGDEAFFRVVAQIEADGDA